MPKVINHASQFTYSHMTSNQQETEREMESSPTSLQKLPGLLAQAATFQTW